jgi:peptidoglycan/LPS O-acetylase OafA/YrhL
LPGDAVHHLLVLIGRATLYAGRMTHSPAGAPYPPRKNLQIHGLRGLSALAVFVYHVFGMGLLWGFWPAVFAPVEPLFAAGKHGVEIFFIISGFLITGSLIRHASAGRFLTDRAIRIYPVFMTIQLLVFALGPFIHYKFLAGIAPVAWLIAFIENGLFLPGLFDLDLAQLNAWSLSYEAAFYLLSAAIFLMARRFGRVAALILLAAALALLLPIYPRAAFFLPGVVAYLLTRRASFAPSRWLRALSIPAFLATLALLTLAETRGGVIWWALAPALLFFLAIVDGKCLLSAGLRIPALQFLGTISYSFYLWSPVVTYPMKLLIQRALLGRLDDVWITLMFASVGLAASLVVAALSYRLLEVRLAEALRRWAA